MKHTLDKLLTTLCECATLSEDAELHRLSTLESYEVERVRRAWPLVAVNVRRQLVGALVEAAEVDFELDFGAVFRLGIEDEDPEVRAISVEGLWEDEDARLIPLLIRHVTDEESSRVRAAAAKSLGRFVLLGELEKIRARPFNQVCDALLTVCCEENETVEVRRRAVESLAYVGTKPVEELIHQAYLHPDEKMRVSAVFAMGRSGDQRWARHVQKEIFNPNPEFRYEAARASGELQLSDVVQDLEELADDVDAEVREATLWALGQIGGDRAREILEHYSASDNEATSAAAEAALNDLTFLHGDLNNLLSRLVDMPDEP